MKFPLEFDALDLATDELKQKLLPVSRKLKEFEKERAERRKVRKRTKATSAAAPSTSTSSSAVPNAVDVEMGDSTAVTLEASSNQEKVVVDGGELEEESVFRAREAEELEALVSEDVKNDLGASTSGLYDLVCRSIHNLPCLTFY